MLKNDLGITEGFGRTQRRGHTGEMTFQSKRLSLFVAFQKQNEMTKKAKKKRINLPPPKIPLPRCYLRF